MPKLVSVEAVRNRINFEQLADIDAVLDSILERITTDVGKALNTKIPRATVTDSWFVSQSFLFGGTEVPRTWLFCSRGFVNSTSYLVKAGTRQAVKALTISDDIGDYYDIADQEMGVITVSDLSLSGLYVQCTYDAGFDLGTDDLYLDVPDWLQELAIMMTIKKLDSIHPTVRFEDGQGAQMSIERLDGMIVATLDQHLRYEARAVKPYASVES